MSIKSTIVIFKNEEYTYKNLWSLFIEGRKYYQDGDVIIKDTAEVFDIKDFRIFNNKYIEDTLCKLKDLSDDSSLKKKLKVESNKRRQSELEVNFKEDNITPEELRELIKLKYNSEDINKTIQYNHYAFFNLDTDIPDLTDADLGKFYKIMAKLTKKANSILKTKNIKSSPLGIEEISKLLNISDKVVYSFLNKLKKKNIVKHFSYGDNKYIAINPKYILNGNITSATYFIFKEDMEKLFPNIPEEVIKLWEYEFMSSTIQME